MVVIGATTIILEDDFNDGEECDQINLVRHTVRGDAAGVTERISIQAAEIDASHMDANIVHTGGDTLRRITHLRNIIWS